MHLCIWAVYGCVTMCYCCLQLVVVVFFSFSVLIWCEWMQFNVKSSMCDAVDGTRIICALTTNNKIQETILYSTLLHRWCRLCCNIHGNTFFFCQLRATTLSFYSILHFNFAIQKKWIQFVLYVVFARQLQSCVNFH